MKKRNAISIILSLAFSILIFPQFDLPTSAASNASTIDVSDSNPTSMPLGVSYSSGVYTIGVGANTTSITVTGSGTNTIHVASDVTGLTLNLDEVSITSGTASPINIGTKYQVTLHLNDGKSNELIATGSGFAGIYLGNSTIDITGNTGSLTVLGPDVGINSDEVYGVVYIHGGMTTAIGGSNGIYAAFVAIKGGMLTATGGSNGIYAKDRIIILSGTVNATGTYGIQAKHTFFDGGVTTTCGKENAFKSDNMPFFEYGEAVTVASLQLDGSNPLPYAESNFWNYKYLKIEVPSNSTISPTTASFNKYTGSSDYKDIAVTLTPNGNTLSSIWNGSTQLVQNTDYTVSGTTVTILKAYLTSQSAGTTTLTFQFSAGSNQTLAVSVNDTTPSNSAINPMTASFNKYTGSSDYKDIAVTLTPNGNTLSSIWNGSTQLVQNTDYTVAGTTVTIPKTYLASQPTGAKTLTFQFSAGSNQTLAVTVNDTTPSNSTISPTAANFNKYTGSSDYKDIGVTLTPNGNTLGSIWNGSTQLVQNTDYTLSRTTVTILKTYLASQPTGATTLTFQFSAGSNQTLAVSVNDTTPSSSPSSSGGSSGSGGSNNKPAIAKTTAGTGTEAVTTVSTAVTGSTSGGNQTVTVPKDTVTSLTDTAEKSERTGGIAIASIDTGAATGLSQVGVTIPGASFSEFAARTKAALQINTSLGSITFSAYAVDKIGAAGSGDVTFSIGSVDQKSLSATMQKLVGSRPVYRFSVTVGDLNVSEFGSSVTINLPYTLGAKEDPNAIVVFYIDASGALKTMQGKYDAKTGSVIFKTTHFSEYMIGYHKEDFTDVSSSAWYADAVTFLAARGITSGTSDGIFSPDAALTRGQFVVMLLRAYGMEADTNPTDNFKDAGHSYYTGYIATAKRMGITSGVGDNQFAPEKTITRQEMFTLLYNTLKTMGQLPSTDSGKKLSDFSDAGQVDEWAAGAMAALVKAGIVSGNGRNLAPMSMTTRAEMAQILYNIQKQ